MDGDAPFATSATQVPPPKTGRTDAVSPKLADLSVEVPCQDLVALLSNLSPSRNQQIKYGRGTGTEQRKDVDELASPSANSDELNCLLETVLTDAASPAKVNRASLTAPPLIPDLPTFQNDLEFLDGHTAQTWESVTQSHSKSAVSADELSTEPASRRSRSSAASTAASPLSAAPPAPTFEAKDGVVGPSVPPANLITSFELVRPLHAQGAPDTASKLDERSGGSAGTSVAAKDFRQDCQIEQGPLEASCLAEGGPLPKENLQGYLPDGAPLLERIPERPAPLELQLAVGSRHINAQSSIPAFEPYTFASFETSSCRAVALAPTETSGFTSESEATSQFSALLLDGEAPNSNTYRTEKLDPHSPIVHRRVSSLPESHPVLTSGEEVPVSDAQLTSYPSARSEEALTPWITESLGSSEVGLATPKASSGEATAYQTQRKVSLKSSNHVVESPGLPYIRTEALSDKSEVARPPQGLSPLPLPLSPKSTDTFPMPEFVQFHTSSRAATTSQVRQARPSTRRDDEGSANRHTQNFRSSHSDEVVDSPYGDFLKRLQHPSCRVLIGKMKVFLSTVDRLISEKSLVLMHQTNSRGSGPDSNLATVGGMLHRFVASGEEFLVNKAVPFDMEILTASRSPLLPNSLLSSRIHHQTASPAKDTETDYLLDSTSRLETESHRILTEDGVNREAMSSATDSPLWVALHLAIREGLERLMVSKLTQTMSTPLLRDCHRVDAELLDRMLWLRSWPILPRHLESNLPEIHFQQHVGLASGTGYQGAEVSEKADAVSFHLNMAKSQLVCLDVSKSPRGKLIRLLNFCRICHELLAVLLRRSSFRGTASEPNITSRGVISQRAAENDNPGVVVTIDDLLPLLIWSLIQLAPDQLYSTVKFVAHLRQPSLLVSHDLYYFTLVESAVEFIFKFDVTESLHLTPEELVNLRASYAIWTKKGTVRSSSRGFSESDEDLQNMRRRPSTTDPQLQANHRLGSAAGVELQEKEAPNFFRDNFV